MTFCTHGRDAPVSTTQQQINSTRNYVPKGNFIKLSLMKPLRKIEIDKQVHPCLQMNNQVR